MTHILCQKIYKSHANIVKKNTNITNNTFTSNMLKQNEQNNKSTKVNNNDQVKLEFNSDDLDDNENKIIEQSKKRSLTIDKTDITDMVTPKRNAIDIIKAKIQKTPVQSYKKNRVL